MTYNEPAVHVFIALNLIGGIGMVFVLVTCLACRHVKRLETWYSFCFSWVLSAAAYSLLFLSGDQGNPQPIYAVCYTQAALTYALPPTYVDLTDVLRPEFVVWAGANKNRLDLEPHQPP